MPIYIDAEVHNDENKGMLVILEVYIGELLSVTNPTVSGRRPACWSASWGVCGVVAGALTLVLRAMAANSGGRLGRGITDVASGG